MLKSTIKAATPPFIWGAARYLKNAVSASSVTQDDSTQTALFDGDTALIQTCAQDARIYGEYGVGQSTLWIAEQTRIPLRSIDTSKDWIAAISAQLPKDRATLTWIDLGDLGDWGRPKAYTHRANFMSYAEALWREDETPDLVLIDGRFRVTCFLVSLARARPGTRILFDDYVERPHYHLVEEFLAPSEKTDRQALFIVPEVVDQAVLLTEAERFSMVMD